MAHAEAAGVLIPELREEQHCEEEVLTWLGATWIAPCFPAVKPVRTHWYSAPVAVLQAFGHTSTEAESVLLSVVGMGGAVLGKEGSLSVTSLL